MATIQEAVQSAKTFAVESLEPGRIASLQLEEVESANTSSGEAWLITLSMPDPARRLALLSGVDARDYKVFTVLKSNGEVISMKIRALATK